MQLFHIIIQRSSFLLRSQARASGKHSSDKKRRSGASNMVKVVWPGELKDLKQKGGIFRVRIEPGGRMITIRDCECVFKSK